MVIDSHALLWWLEEDSRLSERGRQILNGEDPSAKGLIVSSVTFWELRLKEVRGQLTPKLSVDLWPDLLRKLPHFHIEEVLLRHWFEIAGMPWANRDPADRILAATAKQYGVPVLTVDEKFHHRDSPVKAVW